MANTDSSLILTTGHWVSTFDGICQILQLIFRTVKLLLNAVHASSMTKASKSCETAIDSHTKRNLQRSTLISKSTPRQPAYEQGMGGYLQPEETSASQQSGHSSLRGEHSTTKYVRITEWSSRKRWFRQSGVQKNTSSSFRQLLRAQESSLITQQARLTRTGCLD